ncbi:MAG TPA: hypothetical protein DCO75_11535 [Fibrobacteres bacterium]|nr:hypothetical protein [Fibrobacterota bacterium]
MRTKYIYLVIFFLAVCPVGGESVWKQLPLHNEQKIHSLTAGIDGNNQSILVAACRYGTYSSHDSGKTWLAYKYYSFVDTPVFTSMLILGPKAVAAQSSIYIRMSDSSGITWIDNHMISMKGVKDLINMGGIIFVNYDHGIAKSLDSGDSWNYIPQTGLTDSCVKTLGLSGNSLFAATADSGVFVSTDSGKHWESASTGLPGNGNGGIINVRAFSGSQDNMFFCICDSGMYRLKTGPQEYYWEKASSGIPSTSTIQCAICFIGSDSQGYIITGTDSGPYRSPDTGATWEATGSGLDGQATGFNAVAIHGTELYAATDAGVYRSTDNGSHWSAINIHCDVLSLASGKSALFTGTSEGVYHSTDQGASWSFDSIVSTQNSNIYAMATIGDTTIAVKGKGSSWNVVFSNDTGNTWSSSSVNSILDHNTGLAVLNDCIFVGESGFSGIYKSCNYGEYWTRVEDDIISASNYNFDVSLVAAYDKCVYIYGKAYIYSSSTTTTSSGFYSSSDDGDTWTLCDSGLTGSVTSFAASGDVFFATTAGNGHCWRSLNRGKYWKSAGSMSVDSITSLLTVHNYVIAGTSDGVYVSGDQGKTWHAVTTGLTNTNISAIMTDSTYIYAGTRGAGVYQFPISEIPVDVSVKKSPLVRTNAIEKFSVAAERITFYVPSRMLVSIELFNLNGQIAASLCRNVFESGNHTLKFDRKGLSQGTYLLRVHTGSSVTNSFPMVIVR